MINNLNANTAEFAAEFAALMDRDTPQDQAIEATVKDIIAAIRSQGDSALIALSNRFDALNATTAQDLEIPPAQINAAYHDLDPALRTALNAAAARIRHYHQQEVGQSWTINEADGSRFGQIVRPLDSVGVYVPGGKAAYPSSVLMTVIPAKVAGVGNIIMAVPTPGGICQPAVLAAAKIAGADRVFCIGGAQAVAALAYGTQTVPPVDKIVGPGNAYVAAAKRQVFGKVGIDMIAGPSEVAIIADAEANAAWIAMDLCAQAEHDERAQAILLTHSKTLAQQVVAALDKVLPTLPRQAIIRAALGRYGAVIVTQSLAQSVAIANKIAPEHLELMVAQPDALIPQIRHAGAIFVGAYSAEALGDYCAGPNHVLPTSGSARFSSPLGVYDYQKRSSLLQISPDGAAELARTASLLAHCEGLTAHARSAEYRLRPASPPLHSQPPLETPS